MASAPTPLEEYPQVRQWAYRAFWVIGLALGAVQIWYATAGGEQPDWLLPALAVLAYVSVATNYTADRNVTIPKEEAVKLSAVPDTPRHAAPVAPPVQTHLNTPPDDERGPANYDERGAYDGTTLLIAIAAIVVIVCGIIWLLGR